MTTAVRFIYANIDKYIGFDVEKRAITNCNSMDSYEIITKNSLRDLQADH